jgi:hypothetical protein
MSVALWAAVPVGAQESPPPSPQAERIVALVEKAAARVDREGKAAFAEFRKRGSEWFAGTTYLFSYDMQSNVLLNPAFPEREGTNTTGQKDASGKLFHAEIIRVAQTAGAGWVSYMFPKPGEKEPSRKWTFVKRVTIDGTQGLIAAGFYPTTGKDQLIGTWRLVSWVMQDDVTGERRPLYGEHAHGSATFTAAGRAFFILTGEGRTAPHTDAEVGAAYRSMVAYTGQYRVEGERFITRVDTAWNEAWVGTDQVRTFKVEGGRLSIVAMSQPNPNFGNKLMHGILEFEREVE